MHSRMLRPKESSIVPFEVSQSMIEKTLSNIMIMTHTLMFHGVKNKHKNDHFKGPLL